MTLVTTLLRRHHSLFLSDLRPKKEPRSFSVMQSVYSSPLALLSSIWSLSGESTTDWEIFSLSQITLIAQKSL